nr:trithorax group protein osa-like [Ipomoea batatas]
MENYTYTSYPESGDSSPRSREIEFENPPWEDPNQPLPPNYKVKFMCSYGGKIHPRPHDNQLTYIGGETKILSVERNIKYPQIISKLASLCDFDTVSFKYQLPGEDLDALISVTTDDDLEHMMHEYDRLYRASPKPARLRLFIFPANPPTVISQSRSFGSDDTKSEKDRFVEALNSGPVQTNPAPSAVVPQPGNADFLFGLEKGVAVPPQVKLRDPGMETVVKEPEIPAPCMDDRMIGSDPIQKHIQDLQRLHLEEQQNMYRRRSDDNLSQQYAGGDYYLSKMPEKMTPVTVQGTLSPQVGYWTEKQMPSGVLPASSLGTEQPVYMIPATASAYHAPMVRPMAQPTAQGYYAVQRMPPEAYRDQTVYNVMSNVPSSVPTVATGQPTLPPQAAQKVPGYSDGYGMVRPQNTGAVGIGMTTDAGGYAQMAYDGGVGRQVYYTPGGMVAQSAPQQQQQYQATSAPQQQQYQATSAPQQQQQYQAAKPAAAVNSDSRPPANLNQDAGKVVPKATQASV